MADDDRMRRRREIARDAFIARRAELGLTQEDVARRAGIVVRSVVNFESQGKWPKPRSRAGLERAVEWPPGELHRRVAGPRPDFDPRLLSEISRLTPAERDWLIAWLRLQPGEEQQPPAAAEG